MEIVAYENCLFLARYLPPPSLRPFLFRFPVSSFFPKAKVFLPLAGSRRRSWPHFLLIYLEEGKKPAPPYVSGQQGKRGEARNAAAKKSKKERKKEKKGRLLFLPISLPSGQKNGRFPKRRKERKSFPVKVEMAAQHSQPLIRVEQSKTSDEDMKTEKKKDGHKRRGEKGRTSALPSPLFANGLRVSTLFQEQIGEKREGICDSRRPSLFFLVLSLECTRANCQFPSEAEHGEKYGRDEIAHSLAP